MTTRFRAALAGAALVSLLVATPSAATLTPIVSIDFQGAPLGPIPTGGQGRPGDLAGFPGSGFDVPEIAKPAVGSRALVFGPPGAGSGPQRNQQAVLTVGAGASRYLVEADVWIEALPAIGCEPVPACLGTTGFSLYLDSPSAFGLRFQADGIVRSTLRVDTDPGSGDAIFRRLGRFEVGGRLHVRALVDLVDATTRIWLAGRELALFEHFPRSSPDLDTVRFATQLVATLVEGDLRVRVDDLFVAAVDDPADVLAPEPSTALLVGLGLVALRRRRA